MGRISKSKIKKDNNKMNEVLGGMNPNTEIDEGALAAADADAQVAVRKVESDASDPMSDTNLRALDVFIGNRLKLRRKTLGMSQDDLGTIIGVTFQQVQKYESGLNRISASKLFVLAKLLGVDVSFFFEGLDQLAPESEALQVLFSDMEENSVKFDPMTNTSTLQLVNAYWKIPEDRRKAVLDFLLRMV